MFKKVKKIIIPLLIVFIVIFSFQDKSNNFNFIEKNDLNPIKRNDLNLSIDTGFTSGRISENIDRMFMTDFIDINKALIQSDTYAICSMSSRSFGDFIRITDFNFSITDEATLEGIEVIVDDFSPVRLGITKVLYSSVRLVFSENIYGIEKSDSSSVSEFDINFYYSFGGASDTWSSGLTIANIKDTTFGVQISYFNNDRVVNRVFVDHIQIKIYYSISEEPPPDEDPLPDDECIADTIIRKSWMFGTIGIMFFLMVITLFLYLKTKEFLPILFVFLFSIIISIGSISIQLPFTPYFQIFFMLFQTIFFMLAALNYYNNKKRY